MPSLTAPPPGLLQRLGARIGNPLEWSDADKCIGSAAVLLLFLLYQELSVGYFLAHPEIAPYVNRDGVRFALTANRWLIAAWAGIAGAGLFIRKRAPYNRAVVLATICTYAAGAAWGSYFTGLYTFPWGTILILTGGVAGFLLFELRLMLWGIAFGLALVVGATLAEITGLIPSAPMFLEAPPPFGGRGFSQDLYLWAPFLIVCELSLLGIYAYVIARWRDREEKLAEAKVLLSASNDRLTEAMGLIRRYVPAQLAERIVSGAAAPEAYERRTLTIFFSDIKGFTQASEKLEADHLARVLNEYLAEMSEIAKKHGGTLDKFVGDAVMVFFGAPDATGEKDQALRAVRMALEMQRRMIALRARWSAEGIETPFEIRIGINTGPVHVGNFGAPDRMDYTVIGHHVNLAARLESNCTPGKVLLSRSTYEFVRDEIACVDRGEIKVKGISEPVAVYEVEVGVEAAAQAG